MMNKFKIVNCAKPNEQSNVHMISLMSEFRSDLKIYFPLPESKVNIVKALMSEDSEEEIEVQEHDKDQLDLYATMIDSWKLGDKIISGVVLDASTSEKSQSLLSSIILVLPDGQLDLFMKVDFSIAIIVATFEDLPIYITEELLQILLDSDPDKLNAENSAENDTEEKDTGNTENSDPFSSTTDNEIIGIAQKIIEQGKKTKKSRKKNIKEISKNKDVPEDPQENKSEDNPEDPEIP